MGEVTYLPVKGSALETLYQAAEECKADESLRAVVVMFGEDATEIYASYSENVDPISAFYALSVAAQWQTGVEVEE